MHSREGVVSFKNFFVKRAVAFGMVWMRIWILKILVLKGVWKASARYSWIKVTVRGWHWSGKYNGFSETKSTGIVFVLDFRAPSTTASTFHLHTRLHQGSAESKERKFKETMLREHIFGDQATNWASLQRTSPASQAPSLPSTSCLSWFTLPSHVTAKSWCYIFDWRLSRVAE